MTTKILRSSKTEHVAFSTLLKLISYISFRNELRSIEFNSLFTTRCRNAEIIKKKKV